ncbi:MAG: outer membrane beta-barrel protein [Verrucomicrobiota bacterium]
MRFNDGRDQIFLTYTAGVSYDSNIFTASGGSGDYVFNSGLSLEYMRRAGLIGINGNLGWGFSKFASFSSEDFATPNVGLEFTKSTGRTTGSLTLSGSQSSKPDINTNIRTESFNYNVGLGLRYPVIERYSLAGNFSYGGTDYRDNSAGLADLHTHSAGIDLFYAWRSDRDLIFGYRYRHSDTSADTASVDHNINTGVSGKIWGKVNGSIRVGLQQRVSEPLGGGPDETFTGVTTSISATWTVSKRVSVTGIVARDFNTTSTSTNTESTTFTLSGQYAVNAKLSLNAQVSTGINDYLDAASGNRQDNYYSYGFGFSYVLHPHLTIAGSYDYFSNSSTLAVSEFDRHIFSLNLTSRW